MKSAFAVSALLALAGSSHGFIVNQFAIQPNQSITASSGGFVNTYTGYFHSGAGLVTNSGSAWNNFNALIRGSTWLGADRLGGGGVFFGLSTDPPGPPGPVPAPEWAGSNGNILGGPGVGTADPAASITAGVAGLTWGAGSNAGFQAPSAVSPVNGVSIDSIFFANFALTDPNATLIGADLLATIDGVNYFLPLDGSAKGENPYQIAYERDGNVLRAFVVVVPTPGAIGLAGLTGLAALRRRRR